MVDSRVIEHAKILVNYACEVKRGDYVLVRSFGVEALPLIREIAAEVGRKGAHIATMLMENSVTRAYLMNTD